MAEDFYAESLCKLKEEVSADYTSNANQISDQTDIHSYREERLES